MEARFCLPTSMAVTFNHTKSVNSMIDFDANFTSDLDMIYFDGLSSVQSFERMKEVCLVRRIQRRGLMPNITFLES